MVESIKNLTNNLEVPRSSTNSSPSVDSYLYSLARRPSRKSVKLANTNIKKGIKSPKKPGI